MQLLSPSYVQLGSFWSRNTPRRLTEKNRKELKNNKIFIIIVVAVSQTHNPP